MSRAPPSTWEGPLFIVGMPRSGTKLLRGLLSKHPRIRILAAETDFLPFIEEWVERHGNPATPQAFEQLAHDMKRRELFQLPTGGARPVSLAGLAFGLQRSFRCEWLVRRFRALRARCRARLRHDLGR